MNLLRLNHTVHPVVWNFNFFSGEEIDKIFEYVNKLNKQNALIGNGQEKKKEEFKPDSHIKNLNTGFVPRIRQTQISWIELNKETNWLFKKIIQQIHKVNSENFDYILRFVENLQFSEYNEKERGFYSKHNDCELKDSMNNYVDIRKLSFSVQLSDPSDYEGGELILYHNNEKKVMPKERGTIVFFSSNIEHEVTPVKKGTRYALVSWVQGPNLR